MAQHRIKYKIRPAKKSDSPNLAKLYLRNFPYVFRSLFGTDDKKTIKVLSLLCKVFKGNNYWGYRDIFFALDKKDEIAGFISLGQKKGFNWIPLSLSGILYLGIILFRGGPSMCLRFLNGVLRNRGASPKYSTKDLYVSYIALNQDRILKDVSWSMLNFAEKEAKKRKMKNLVLDVRINNLLAVSLFSQFGFQKVKIISDNAYGLSDRLFMKKIIL